MALVVRHGRSDDRTSPATVTTTAVSKPSLDLRGEVDVALKNDEALLLLSVWAAVGHFGGAATNP